MNKKKRQLIILSLFVLTIGIFFVMDRFSVLIDENPEITKEERERTKMDCLNSADDMRKQLDCLQSLDYSKFGEEKVDEINMDYRAFVDNEFLDVETQIRENHLVITRRDSYELENCLGDFFFLAQEGPFLVISTENKDGVIICQYDKNKYVFYYPSFLTKEDLRKELNKNVARLSLDSLKEFLLKWKTSFESN